MRSTTTLIGFRWLQLAAGLGMPALFAADVVRPVEDAAARLALPEFVTIPHATAAELTPANGSPVASAMTTWTRSHGDAGSRRYSALTQINRTNVTRLAEAWTFRSGDGAANVQCNPIVVDGVLFAPTPGNALVALDAATGAERWRTSFTHIPAKGLSAFVARRGLLYWPGEPGYPARLIVTYGDWVCALNPSDGKPIEGFGRDGRVAIETGGTAAGVVYRHVLVVPGLEGDVFGYDVRTGALLWRFNTVPREGEFGADTWQGADKDGAHCWGGLSLDEDRGLVFVATGAPRTDYIGVGRLGDNLFSNCLVALDALTGERRWHFQNIRHDLWDLDNPAPPNLVTIERDGRKIDAVAAVTKLGNTLLLDRVSGKPIFPFRLRRAPVSTLPGEVTAPYQPALELPEDLTRQEFNLDDVTRRTPAAYEHVLARVRLMNHGWFEPFAEGKPTAYFSTRGGAEWSGAAVDVPTGRLYVTTNRVLSIATVFRNDDGPRDPKYPPSAGETVYQNLCAACHGPDRKGTGMAPPLLGLARRTNDSEVSALLDRGRNAMPALGTALDATQRRDLLDFLFRRGQPPTRPAAKGDSGYSFHGYQFVEDPEGYPGCTPPWGLLNCLDLNTGKILWRVPLGEYEELTRAGLPKTGQQNLGGATVTAGGLVFCAGTPDRRIRAFDSDTGEELWSARLPFAGYAAPTVYEAEGRQFVVIAATGGGKVGGPAGDAYVAFALPVAAESAPARAK